MNYLKLALPFSVLGLFFIILGLLLNDKNSIFFGTVWLVISLIAYIVKKKPFSKFRPH